MGNADHAHGHYSTAWTRRKFLGAVVLTGAGTALTGCGVSAGDGDKGDGTGTINALFMKQAGYSEDDIKAMTAAFQKANPKIKVQPTFVAYEALHDKIVAAAPAGTYDVVLIDVIWPPEFGSKNMVRDVTGKYPADWKSGMLDGALKTATYQDKFYGVPWILDTKYFFANTDHLQRAKVDQVSLGSWDGVLAAARAVKKAGVKYPFMWSWSQAEAVVCDYTQLLGAFGGKFLDDAGKPAFNTGGGVQALEFMRTTVTEGLTNPASMESVEEDVRKTFSNGDASFALNWTYMYGLTQDPKESKVVGKVAIMQTPAGASGARPGVNGSMALSVTNGSKNQDAAWKFISFLTSPDEQAKYAKSSLPVWTASYDEPAVTKAAPQTVPVAKKQLAELILRPQVASYNAVSALLQAEIQNALLGKKPAQKALDDAAKGAADILAKN
jgi:multiple sugar transport system substrate-binding protein